MDEKQFVEKVKELNIELTSEKLKKLKLFYNLLIEYNENINLTRIIEEKEVYLKHFYDSLIIAKYVDLTKIKTLCDVGSGAGFPGIVLKIFFPEIKMTLVDSLLKRVKYLNEVIKKLELEDIKATHSRAEDLNEKFDIVTSRAVANIEKLTSYTMHLLDEEGIMVALKGDIDKELDKKTKIKIEKKYKIKKIEKFLLPFENSKRSIIIMENKKNMY